MIVYSDSGCMFTHFISLLISTDKDSLQFSDCENEMSIASTLNFPLGLGLNQDND